MNVYFARLEQLRGRLVAAGHDDWAMKLLSAERSASTSGEALSNTGVVLKELLAATEMSSAIRSEVQSIYADGDRIWNRKAD
jgi:hypothetical protein